MNRGGRNHHEQDQNTEQVASNNVDHATTRLTSCIRYRDRHRDSKHLSEDNRQMQRSYDNAYTVHLRCKHTYLASDQSQLDLAAVALREDKLEGFYSETSSLIYNFNTRP